MSGSILLVALVRLYIYSTLVLLSTMTILTSDC